MQFPMLYYTHNIVGAVNLIEAMRKHKCRNVCSLDAHSCCFAKDFLASACCVQHLHWYGHVQQGVRQYSVSYDSVLSSDALCCIIKRANGATLQSDYSPSNADGVFKLVHSVWQSIKGAD